MFMRQPPARRGLSLSRLNSIRRPQPVARTPCLHSFHTSDHRLLTAPVELPPRRRKILRSQDVHGSVFQRSLATAIGDPLRQDDLSYKHIQQQLPNNFLQPPMSTPLYEIRPFDPSLPLLIKSNDIPFPRSRTNNSGIPGGADEMVSVFDACLQVGKLDRAALVLTRLKETGALPGSELITLHNQYLRAAIARAFDKPDSEWAKSLHKWYEVHIRAEELPQTPETIACMLKVSLLSAREGRLSRLVTRYMDMMPGDAIFQVLSEVDILTQQDFGTITSIYQPASDLLEEWNMVPEAEELQPSPAEASATQSIDLSEAKPTSSDTPEVLAVPQKGMGLKSLRGVLSFFTTIKSKDISQLPLAERREIQAQLEKDCVDAAISRWREENDALKKMGLNTSMSTSALNSQLYDWQCALETKLENEFALFEESEKREKKVQADFDRCLYAPFMKQSSPSRLAAVTIISVLNALSSAGIDRGIQLSTLLIQIAKTVEDDIKFLKRQQQMALRRPTKKRQFKPNVDKEKEEKEMPMSDQEQDNPISSATIQPSADANAESNVVESLTYDVASWPLLIRTKVGAALLSALMETAKMDVVQEHPQTKALIRQRQPAIAHTMVHRRGKKVGLVMPNKFLVEILKREPPADFLARHLPMLVEPEPWSKFDKGGFLEYPTQLVRVKHGERDQKIYTEAAMQRGDMEQVSKGLDVLGKTGWRINKPVFDVMLEAWNSGEKIANIPPLNPQIPIPEEPEASDDPLQRRTWLNAVKAVENMKSGLHSERCFMNLQLEIARSFKDQTFYFPHNMDFRGRAYPIPTYLNHMGADHTRGLLRFAKGKALGEHGLRWLKIHLANVFGYDKASLKERESFVMDHLEDIYDSATNPLTGKQWWLQAEDSWQCLAACFELKAALQSPDPFRYVSHLPVHQDGTCNGLQHYAALGGDMWGAQQVNLEPGDRPADVYSAVAELVKESITEDLKEDNFLAKAIDGKITRKVVKQTVMTNVYGVTFSGAKEQVLKQIDALYPNIFKETEVPTPILASYIATKIFKALSTMFRGAHDIQYWFGECAGRVCRAIAPEQIERIANGEGAPIKKRASKSQPESAAARKRKSASDELLSQFRSTVIWTTPLRMPIVQPYRKSGTRIIPTSIQDLTLQIPERSDPVNRRKQLQAFPPNFIHSLDASHMLLSALECDELGLSFAAVHDSFWTHASDIEVMNRVLRDCFVRIHSEDVIGRLASEFEARHKGALYLAKLDKGHPAEARIASLRKGRKLTMKAELLEEYQRTQLLNSTDPEKVKEGREMVTPGSIFEEMSVSQPLSSAEDMDAVGLGNIPKEDATTPALEGEFLEEPEDDGDGIFTAQSSGKIKTSREHIGETDLEHYKTMIELTSFEAELSGEAKKASEKSRARSKENAKGFNIWLPLTFPEVPKKGDYNVERLKESQYFFS
ncbi:DNA/RNA polymerase [Annulohypoxylon maeteangense]|uniref:DNA/RNA polymerase n=1 Tax=Annulohypoxylon maeteangense TaxID=1927788 RepID=UPI0020082F71|nr:DNA/RNA polymerase [Annulohypoxylon maeteangense]KAI0888974.1 DNA/RNA polymerase [Annulohypoxylon maeteangense]